MPAVVPEFKVKCLLSVLFLLDALRIIRSVTAGTFVIDTWQMIWHLLAFTLVVVTGVGLDLITRNPWDHPKIFYAMLELVISIVVLAEIPFLYIINRLVSQSLSAQK